MARDVAKVLRSAVANAQQKEGFGGEVERLFVSKCHADNGPSMKRVRPAPMGRAFRIVKRTTHLTVEVTERPQVVKAVGTDGAGQARAARGQEERSRPRPSKREITVGQKVHPYGFRIGFNKTWKSRWFADKEYADLLHEDLVAQARSEEALPARRRRQGRDRARGQQAEDRHPHLAARASSSAARGRKSTS